MSRFFDGVLHLSCEEMSAKYEGSSQSWRRYARIGKVPAIKYGGDWFFEPEKAFNALVENNGYTVTGENTTNAEQGFEVDLSDLG